MHIPHRSVLQLQLSYLKNSCYSFKLQQDQASLGGPDLSREFPAREPLAFNVSSRAPKYVFDQALTSVLYGYKRAVPLYIIISELRALRKLESASPAGCALRRLWGGSTACGWFPAAGGGSGLLPAASQLLAGESEGLRRALRRIDRRYRFVSLLLFLSLQFK